MLTMSSMAHNRKEFLLMNEKVYRSMNYVGAWNIAIGIATLVLGVAVGVMSILHGAKLLKEKKSLLF